MFNIKQLVNKITDKGGGREGESSTASASLGEGQDSSEGFICPMCMRAFPSADSLSEHYKSVHPETKTVQKQDSSDEIIYLQNEILQLQTTLAEERSTADDVKRELIQIRSEIGARDDMVAINTNLRSQEKEFEEAKSFMSSEIALLRSQVKDGLEIISNLRKDNSTLTERLDKSETENGLIRKELVILEDRATQIRSEGENSGESNELKQELESARERLRQISVCQDENAEVMRKKIKELECDLNERENEAKANVELIKTINEEKSQFQAESQAFQKQIIDLNNVIKNCNAEHQNAIEALNSQYLNSERILKVKEDECKEMKEEITRQRTHHAELLSKIEGGEGMKEALEGLQKENEIIKANLESVQNQMNEQCRNLHNSQMEAEKWQSEYKRISEANDAAQEKWKAQHVLSVEQLKGKDEELRSLTRKIDELQKCIQAKDNDMRSQLGEFEKRAAELEKASQNLKSINAKLAQDLKEKSEREKSLGECLAKKEEELSQCNMAHKSEIGLLEKKVEETNQKFEQSQAANKKVDELRLTLEKSRLELEDKYKTSVLEHQKMEKKYKDASHALEETNSKLRQSEEIRSSSADEMMKLRHEMDSLVGVRKEKESEIEDLARNLKDLNSKFLESESKVNQLREANRQETNELLNEKTDLERKWKTSEEEKSLLLQRCLSGESENERLDQMITELKRKLEDSLAGLFEMGRENQNLQMETAKLQGRKWTDDSLVSNCMNLTCEKEFSLTIRKHHCRNCGRIFCNSCSSQAASIPSSKKPVRVCMDCFQELNSQAANKIDESSSGAVSATD